MSQEVRQEVPEGMCAFEVKDFNLIKGTVIRSLCGKVETHFSSFDHPKSCRCGRPVFVPKNEFPLGYMERILGGLSRPATPTAA